MWKEINIDIGKVQESKSKTFTFESTEPIELKEVRPGCGSCTKIVSITEKGVTVKYTAGNIPKHLEAQGKKDLFFTKSITVTHSNGKTEKLYFKGKIVK